MPAIASAIGFSEIELSRINSALLMLEESFAGKLIGDQFSNASPDGVLANDIEDFSDLPLDDQTVLLNALPAFANISQWGSDEKIREQLNPIALRLKHIAQQVISTNRAVLMRCWNSSAKY